MRVLICRPNRFLAEELMECFRSSDWEADVAVEPGSIYQSLSRQRYELSLYFVSSLDDFAVIKYINTTYPDIEVVITSDTGFEASIENVRRGAFTTLSQPYNLNHLKEFINNTASRLELQASSR